MVQYSQDLPEIYQNFNAVDGVEESEVARLGSSVTLADFCPYIQVGRLYAEEIKILGRIPK